MGKPTSNGRAEGLEAELLGLYVHIPFCSAICNYCNFNRGLFDAALKTRYVDALVTEIRQASPKARTTNGTNTPTPPHVVQTFRSASRDALRADTIYFGGGTPSLL